MNADVKVSVVCITYNQENFIKDALDGFLLQEPKFQFEVIVADDASSDGTSEIVREYATLHPGLFQPVLRNENVGIAVNLYDAMRRASGQYIAICEGDDYWSDPEKLQVQADLMDRNESCTLCFHPVRVVYEDGDGTDAIFPVPNRVKTYTLYRLLERNFMQTNSVMYRRRSYERLPTHIMPVDWYLHALHAKEGRIEFVDRVMGVYRRHAGGAWWADKGSMDAIWSRHGKEIIAVFIELQRLFRGDATATRILQEGTARMLNEILRADATCGSDNLGEIVEMGADSVEVLLRSQNIVVAEMLQKRRTLTTKKSRVVRFMRQHIMQSWVGRA